jgi:hypothetical protein
VVPSEQRVELPAEEEIDPSHQDRRHGRRSVARNGLKSRFC